MENIIKLPWHKNFGKDSDTKLAKASIKGDSLAFTELMKRHKVDLYKIAYSYIKDEQKALDILQETTSKGLVNIDKLKEPKYFKTWITRVLINISIDYSKKEANVVYLNEETVSSEYIEHVGIEEKLDLYDAIDTLRENYKMVIILKYFNDMTDEQIAKTMDIPINTIKSYLRRARIELKNILSEGEINE